MALPFPTNTTCDIYRNANAPPAAPDVAAVPGYLRPDFEAGQTTKDNTDFSWTHVLLVAADVDVRDGFSDGIFSGTANDTLWVPDSNGTRFQVRFVCRVGRGTPQDHKRVYLERSQPVWPSDEV